MSAIVIILIPLIAIVLLAIKERHRILYYAAISTLALSNILILVLTKTHLRQIDLGWNFVFLIDRYSWFFAVLINVAWLITIVYSFSFISYDFQAKAARFNFYLSLVIASALATGFAGNLFTLFVFYTLSIPFIYPLITLRDSPEALVAGKFYLKQTLIPACLIFLPAVLVVYQLEGNFNFINARTDSLASKPILASILLAMFIIGMSKNCVIPFNTWLPRTMLAPAPVSALIHSVAAVKSGPIALMKIAVYVYGLDFLHDLSKHFWYTGWLTYLCGFSAIYAAYRALKVTNLKQRFSYSTVSQLSYIITAILISSKTAILAAMLHIITHSIAKICLFFVAGLYNCLYDTVDTRQIAKLAPHTRLLVLCIAVSGLSIAGFPFLAGYLSKDLMLLEELHSGNYAAVIFLLFGSALNFAYIIPIIQAAFRSSDTELRPNRPIPIPMRFAIGVCLIIIILLSFYTYYLIRAFEDF